MLTIGKAQLCLSQLQGAVARMVVELQEKMRSLLFSGDSLPLSSLAGVVDDTGNHAAGYHMGVEKGNACWIRPLRRDHLGRVAQSLARRAPGPRPSSGGSSPFDDAFVREYLPLVDGFLELLLVTVHLTAGQPARCPELLSARFANTPVGGVRNVMVKGGQVCITTTYSKDSWSRVRPRVIERFLPAAVGPLVVLYVCIVIPFVQEILPAGDGPWRPSAYLWTLDTLLPPPPRMDGPSAGKRCAAPLERPPHAYKRLRAMHGASEPVEDAAADLVHAPGPPPRGADAGLESDTESDSDEDEEAAPDHAVERLWPPAKMQRLVSLTLGRFGIGPHINVRTWRHMAIAIGRRIRHPDGVHNTIVPSREGSPPGHPPPGRCGDTAWDLQAAHGTATAEAAYAVEARSPFVSSRMHELFRSCSRQWHLMLGFRRDAASGLSDAVDESGPRRRRFEALQALDLGYQLQVFLGNPSARFRGRQEQVLRQVIAGAARLLYVAGTGSGKSLSFLLPAFCSPRDGVTVLIVPLLSLRDDMERRCREARIPVEIWRGDIAAMRQAAVVIVTGEAAATEKFHTYLNVLEAGERLDRIVVDECHVVLDAQDTPKGYMKGYLGLKDIFQKHLAPVLLLTATLPPSEQPRLLGHYNIGDEELTVVRGPACRPNLRYRVTAVSGPIDTAFVVREVKRLHRKLAAAAGAGAYRAGPRLVVYTETVQMCRTLAQELSCLLFCSQRHVLHDPSLMARNYREWVGSGGIIVATSALGMGIDLPDVRAVVYVGQIRCLREFAQQSGRAGRDGLPAQSLVLTRCFGDGLRDSTPADEYVTGRGGCRRQALEGYLDGPSALLRCGAAGDTVLPCDLCQEDHPEDPPRDDSSEPSTQHSETSDKVRPPSLPPGAPKETNTSAERVERAALGANHGYDRIQAVLGRHCYQP